MFARRWAVICILFMSEILQTGDALLGFSSLSCRSPCVAGDEEIMKDKEHGTSHVSVQDNLRWDCDRKIADRICNFNSKSKTAPGPQNVSLLHACMYASNAMRCDVICFDESVHSHTHTLSLLLYLISFVMSSHTRLCCDQQDTMQSMQATGNSPPFCASFSTAPHIQ
jgi:hypothetical protein